MKAAIIPCLTITVALFGTSAVADTSVNTAAEPMVIAQQGANFGNQNQNRGQGQNQQQNQDRNQGQQQNQNQGQNQGQNQRQNQQNRQNRG